MQYEFGIILHLYRRQHQTNFTELHHELLISFIQFTFYLFLTIKYITLCSYSCCAELSPRKPCLTCGGRNGGQPDRVYTLGCHRLHWIYRHWDPPWNLSFCCHRQEARAAISSFASIIRALYVFPSLTFSVSWEKELILILWHSSYFLSQNLLRK
jgi:hypothetical protein